ncbi:unnamed protein product [Effrenium voratum]|nr:unnamed protein product [Effrenium voratum]
MRRVGRIIRTCQAPNRAQGLLLQERAETYAEELRIPTICEDCGKPHVPYLELMKASGRQLSLAYQIFPFGAVIGKACERFNNPPLLYWGSTLKCLNASPHITSVRGMQGRKMSAGQAGKPRTVWTGKVPVGLSLLSGTGKIQVPLEL